MEEGTLDNMVGPRGDNHDTNTTIKQLKSKIQHNIKDQCIKEPNPIAANAAIKQHQMDISVNTKGQFTKESNTFVANAVNQTTSRGPFENRMPFT